MVVDNLAGISGIEDKVTIAESEAESCFYTVKKGDTLSVISKEIYGNANLYKKILKLISQYFLAQKIYFWQVLSILQKSHFLG